MTSFSELRRYIISVLCRVHWLGLQATFITTLTNVREEDVAWRHQAFDEHPYLIFPLERAHLIFVFFLPQVKSTRHDHAIAGQLKYSSRNNNNNNILNCHIRLPKMMNSLRYTCAVLFVLCITTQHNTRHTTLRSSSIMRYREKMIGKFPTIRLGESSNLETGVYPPTKQLLLLLLMIAIWLKN